MSPTLPDWSGETAFIVGGGTSVLSQNIDLLRGRKVIVINSSYERIPWADILLFSDSRWWSHHRQKLADFSGLIIAVRDRPVTIPNAVWFKKRHPPGLSTDPTQLKMRRTSLTAAINAAAVHLRASAVVLLGADGKRSEDGTSHHHTPHPWPVKKGCWDEHRAELGTLVEPLRQMGVPVVNASPGSAWSDLWPVMSLPDAIAATSPQLAAAE